MINREENIQDIREVEYPTCGDDEVIIRVMTASICKGVEHGHDQEGVGTDLAKYPVIPGHEFAGYVEEVGANVSRYSNRVTELRQITLSIAGIVIIAARKNRIIALTFGSLGHNINGGFAEYVRSKEGERFSIYPTDYLLTLQRLPNQ